MARKFDQLPGKAAVRLRRVAKAAYHTLFGAHYERILFIFGCQRSGTTLIQNVLEKDWQSKIYPEVGSRLSRKDKALGLKLDPLPLIKAEFARQKAPFLVAKPLVDSQNARYLLDSFDEAKGLWLYRHYNDVVLSKLKKFGQNSGIGDLRYIAQDVPHDWRTEMITPETRALVKSYFSFEMDPYDAAALYWLVRNQLYFDQTLFDHSRLLLCRYEAITADPLSWAQQFYQFVDMPFPGQHLVSTVHSQSVGSGKEVRLSPSVQALCEEMLTKLDKVFQHNFSM